MSGTDSLYSVSVSPPPHNMLSEPADMDDNIRVKFTPIASRTSVWRITDDTDHQPAFGKHYTYKAPTAHMVEPSIGVTSNQSPMANRSRQGHVRERSPVVLRFNSKLKDLAYFQAQADAKEAARDQADPDFEESRQASVTQDTIVSPRKRRREDQELPTLPSPPLIKVKLARQRNCLYEPCKKDTKLARDKHIARIRENWNVPSDRWMPANLVPTITKKCSGKPVKEPLKDPRDWNGRLLEELAYLSNSTANRPATACEALRNAASRFGRDGVPELLPTDVQYAIRNIERRSVLESAQAPARDPLTEVTMTDISTEEVLAQAAADMDRQDAAPGPSTPPRSPTFGHDSIKQESQSKLAIPFRPSGGDLDYQAELDRLEEYDLEKKVAQAELAHYRQLKRMRELARQHGKSPENAILVGAAY